MPFPKYSALPATLRLLRPEQWTKNAIILAALFFAYWDKAQSQSIGAQLGLLLPRALAATIIFCAVSSGIYALNDCRDRLADMAHPVKRLRPVASGEIQPWRAYLISAVLCIAGYVAAVLLDRSFAVVVAGYLVLQIVYSFKLKQVPLLDVFMIATGFVLRAIAGAAVTEVTISPWLLLCTFLLALFLALCKRRQEKTLRQESEQRQSIKVYTTDYLNMLIAISASSTIVSYALYTLSKETVDKFGSKHLILTIPFVIFGIFRYMHLVFNENVGERPERTLLTDKIMICVISLYMVTAICVFIFGRQ